MSMGRFAPWGGEVLPTMCIFREAFFPTWWNIRQCKQAKLTMTNRNYWSIILKEQKRAKNSEKLDQKFSHSLNFDPRKNTFTEIGHSDKDEVEKAISKQFAYDSTTEFSIETR